jgi:transcriptional regulator with XRE-family HTH domain
MKPSAVDVGRHIKRLRIAKALTQKQLAKLLCINYRCISRWENGGVPQAAIRQKLAEHLGATVGEIFLERREYLAILRGKAVTKSLEILSKNPSAATVNAATSSLVRAKDALEEKSASAREEDHAEEMKIARDDLVARLSRLRARKP